MLQSQSLQSKDVLRQKCKEIRLELYKKGHLKEISESIVKKISDLKCFKEALSVMIYHPKISEIDILGLMKFNKKFYLPRCEENKIVVCEYNVDDKLEKSKFGVYEPLNPPIKELKNIDLIIVPALCADKKGNRLGYGRGFYDKFLSNKEIKAKKIVVVPKCLVFENIEKNEFDITCDMIITE